MHSIITKSSRGMSLAEVIVALGLTIILSGVVGYTFISTTKKIRKVELKITAQNIGTQLENTISHTEGVTSSGKLGPNSSLAACLEVSGTCNTSSEEDFFLYTPPPLNVIIAGTEAQPVRYNRQGGFCQDQTRATSNCLFIAKTSFRAHCPGGVASCNQADSVTVSFRVEVDPSLQNDSNLGSLQPRNGSFVVQRDKSAAPPGAVTFSCNPGEFIHEIRSDGSVVCVPFLPNGAAQSCPAGQKVTGLQQDGTVICSHPIAQNQSCPNANEKVVEVLADGSVRCESSLPLNQTCQPGEQISRIREDGSVECGSIIPAGQNCPQGQRITEIRPSGEVVCGDVLPAGGSCPAGQVVSQILPDGSVTCASAVTASNRCAAGQRVVRVMANGSVACANILAGQSANCGAGKYAQGVSATGSVICRNVPDPSSDPPATPGPTTAGGECSMATAPDGLDGGTCQVPGPTTRPHGHTCHTIDLENGIKDWYSCTNGNWVYTGKSGT